MGNIPWRCRGRSMREQHILDQDVDQHRMDAIAAKHAGSNMNLPSVVRDI